MAERRMFAKTIIDSDAFLDMPTSARLLYYDLSMRADDDGFINSPKKIIRMTGASDDDLKVLIAKKFVIPFENGIVVIKHWKIHNYIAKDRYTETKYKEEKAMLKLHENNAYTLSEGKPLNLIEKTKQPLSEARQKRLDVKKESDLPYSFEYKIRNAFVGEKCPICGCTMNYENNLTKPTIQHNKPISLGGKHEIDNISVICNSCNSSIQNRVETPPYNTALVKEKWECIGNVSGMSTQDRLGKVRLGKVSIGKDNIYGQNDQEYEAKFEEFYNKYPKKVKKQEVKKWFLKNKPSNELFSSMMNSLEQFRASKDWQKDGGQFIPYPSTWLNQKRWEDETEKPQKDEWLEGWLKQDD